MTLFAVLSVCVGAILGRWLNVLVLVPTIGLGLVVLGGAWLVNGVDPQSITLYAVVLITGLQAGYIAGALFGVSRQGAMQFSFHKRSRTSPARPG